MASLSLAFTKKCSITSSSSALLKRWMSTSSPSAMRASSETLETTGETLPPNLKITPRALAQRSSAPTKAIPLPDRLNVPILHLSTNSTSGSIPVSPAIFGNDPIRADILCRVVQYQRNKKRGKRTARTKTISEVSGSGRKVRQQKGSGMARAGHSRPPHWRGGAKAHGPKGTIQDYTTKLNSKVRALGLKHALSQKLKEGNLLLVNDWNLSSYKTNYFSKVMMDAFGVGGRNGTTAFLIDAPPSSQTATSHDDEEEEKEDEPMYIGGVNVNLKVASGNIHNVKVVNQLGCNVYDILKHEKLIVSLDALKALEERLD